MQLTTSYSIQGKRSHQEDRYIIDTIAANTNNGDGLLLAVMDGHCGAKVADKLYKNLSPFFADALLETSGNIFAAFDLIIKELQAMTLNSMSGSTLSMVYLPRHQQKEKMYAYTCVVGDSPILILGAGKNYYFSEEHNVSVNQKDVDFILSQNRKLAKAGELEVSQGFLSFGLRYLQLTRAFGDKDFEGIIIREPTNEKIELDQDSIIIVASDGILYEESREPIYKEIIKKAKAGDNAEALVKWILKNDAHDNVTIIVHHLAE